MEISAYDSHEPRAEAPRDIAELAGAIEAMLFIAGDPVDRADLVRALGIGLLELAGALEHLENTALAQRRGIVPVIFGEKVQLLTARAYKDDIDRFYEPARKTPLSQSAMETLSIIAYRQPVTRGEIEEIRGVKCDYAVQSLVKKGLIIEVGRKETLGRPALFGTTDLFLRHLGITRLADLPELPEAGLEAGDTLAIGDEASLMLATDGEG